MKETGVSAQDCYYLEGTSAKAFGSGTGDANCESKTALQFRNGEVAFLLQKAAVSEETWGQTIGTDEYPLLKWQMDEYKKVYSANMSLYISLISLQSIRSPSLFQCIYTSLPSELYI